MRAQIAAAVLGILLGCTKTKAPEHQAQHASQAAATPIPTPTPIPKSFHLKPFRIQLPGVRPQYARLELVLQHRDDPDLKKEIEKRQPQIRNIVLFIVQKKTRAFLLAPDGQDALRKELRIAINQVMRRKIEEVLVTELVIQ